METLLSLLFGSIVGLSLGLTGGGGAIFAVPMLVYGLGVPAVQATTVSLAAVGLTSFLGFLQRWRRGQVELRTGLLFAVAGMSGAPVGAWLGSRIPEPILLSLFAGLMVLIAVRLWRQAARPDPEIQTLSTPMAPDGPTCRRDASGTLLLNTRCAMLLLAVGVLTGLLSGLFGVGGGFVIVPALILFSSMSIHRAVGTSLMVISMVSVSGVAAQLWSGRSLPLALTALFVIGGMAGLMAGQQIGRRLSGPALQRVFSIAILFVALFVLYRNLSS